MKRQKSRLINRVKNDRKIGQPFGGKGNGDNNSELPMKSSFLVHLKENNHCFKTNISMTFSLEQLIFHK